MLRRAGASLERAGTGAPAQCQLSSQVAGQLLPIGPVSPAGWGDGGGFRGTTFLLRGFRSISGLCFSSSLLMSLLRVDVKASMARLLSDSFFSPSGSSSFSVCSNQ